MRILHVITSLGLGGAQVMLRRYLAALGPDGAGHRVVTLLPGGSVGREIADLGVPVSDLGLSSALKLPLAAGRLRRIVRECRPDVLHGWMYHGCLAASLSTHGGVPVVWGIHHSLADLANESWKTRLLLSAMAPLSRRTDAIAYCGRSIAFQHERMGFPAERRFVIPNGIDCTVFRPVSGARERILAELGLPAQRILIGNLTRSHPMKDPAMLVRAVARIVAEGIDAQAIFMGEGHVDGPAREAARACGIDDRVTTLAARADVAEFVAGLDIFALCSAWGEAFPLALAEAMAAGVPSVSTDVGDTGWLLGDTSRLVPPQDDGAMAAVLCRLSQMSTEERHGIGLADRQRVASWFSLGGYVAGHRELYGRVGCRVAGDRLAAW